MKKLLLRLYEIYVLLIYIICKLYCFTFKIKKDTWLIADRGTDAGDNGLFFYKYMKKNHPEIDVKFVVSKKSSDKNKIEHKKDIIYFGTLKHYIYFISSSYLISSHVMGFSPEHRLFIRLDMMDLLHLRGKRIFLQHGIIKDEDYPETAPINRRIHLDMFVCGAKPEYVFLSDTTYFKNNELQYTGLARFDNYINVTKENFILVMPTWRYHLSNIFSSKDFMDTQYYKCWNSFINNDKLIKELEKQNLKLIFYPHHELQQFVNCFNSTNEQVIIANMDDYSVSDLLMNCKMLVTDFSSVFFDICYMAKPVIFYGFDYDDFRKYHHKKGWYDFKNGFGYFSQIETEIVNYVLQTISNDFKVEAEYKNRIESCFYYRDSNNCKRIYDIITKL